MIGVYDYTVVLTYLSLLSGTFGILVCLHGIGHPFFGVFCLLLCGLCDTFDGRVARMKKNRTEMEKAYGIQIDSLSDLVAFGVLPCCIGMAMVRSSERFTDIPRLQRAVEEGSRRQVYPIFLFIIVLGYVLTALIRLAYFNVTEEERSKTEGGCRKVYLGLPVTSAALIFPTVLLMQYLTRADLTPLYFIVMAITAILFITPIRVPKPQLRGILIMVGIGAAEFIIFILVRLFVIRW